MYTIVGIRIRNSAQRRKPSTFDDKQRSLKTFARVGEMDKVIVRYCNNHSTRYDGKEFLESVSKLRREENATGSLEIGESVTIKTKSRLWKAVIVNLQPEASSTKKRKAQTSKADASEPKRSSTISVVRSTVAQSVVCNTLITPFSVSPFANTES